MKRVNFYSTTVYYPSYVSDFTSQKFRDMLVTNAEAQTTTPNKIKFVTESEAYNLDEHYNYTDFPDRHFCIVSWAKIDDSFDLNEIISDIIRLYKEADRKQSKYLKTLNQLSLLCSYLNEV